MGLEEDYKNRSCPCNYGEPCHPRCPCVNKFSSSGCSFCCTYGSLEQREKHAEQIKKKLKSQL